jgi:hypothetical protein
MNRLLVRPCCIRRAKTSDAFRGVDLVIAGPAAAVTGSNRVSIGPTGRSTTGAKAPAPVNDGNARALAGAWSADRGSLELIRSSRGASGIVVAAGVPPGGAAPGAVRKHGSTGRLAMDGGGTSRFASIDPVANGTRRHRSKFELDREAGPFQGLAYDRTTKSRADGSTIIDSTSLSALRSRDPIELGR